MSDDDDSFIYHVFLCNLWGKKNFCREMYVNFTVIHPKKNTFGKHDVKFKVL